MREEYKLIIFQNKVLRRMLVPKGDEGTAGWSKLHSPNINENEMGGV
jgi:hypothetical protein